MTNVYPWLNTKPSPWRARLPVVCEDGFIVSIQAGLGLYSIPNSAVPDAEFTHFELGFPSVLDPLLEVYGDGDDGDIFARVPREVIERFIAKTRWRKKFGTGGNR